MTNQTYKSVPVNVVAFAKVLSRSREIPKSDIYISMKNLAILYRIEVELYARHMCLP